MRNFTLLIAFLGTIQIIFGQSSYLPIKKGDVTMYAYSSTFNQGNDKLRFKTETLDSTVTKNDSEFVIIRNSYGSNGTFSKVKETFTRIDKNGNVVTLDDDEKNESIVIKKNLVLGDSWNGNSDGKSVNSKVISLTKDLETPYKTYNNCLVIESKENEIVLRSYFVKNTGLVALNMVIGKEEKNFIYLIKE